MAELLEVRGLTVELPTPAGWVRPVNEVSLCIGAGKALGLVGESGSGKTMLSLALMGLLPPGARVSGEAWLQDALREVKEVKEVNQVEEKEERACLPAADGLRLYSATPSGIACPPICLLVLSSMLLSTFNY